MSSFTRFWVTHHVIGASCCPLVVTVPATAGVMTALILLAICRTSPCRHMVLANPPNDLAESVCSPRKKCTKTTSLEDVVQDLDIIVKDYKRWTRAAGVCATAKCTDVCSLSSGFMKSTSFVYVAYMSNLISLGIRHLVK